MKKKEEVAAEEVVVKEEKVLKSLPKVNEDHFVLGQELKIDGVPFKVKEIRGIELVLKRTDLI